MKRISHTFVGVQTRIKNHKWTKQRSGFIDPQNLSSVINLLLLLFEILLRPSAAVHITSHHITQFSCTWQGEARRGEVRHDNSTISKILPALISEDLRRLGLERDLGS